MFKKTERTNNSTKIGGYNLSVKKSTGETMILDFTKGKPDELHRFTLVMDKKQMEFFGQLFVNKSGNQPLTYVSTISTYGLAVHNYTQIEKCDTGTKQTKRHISISGRSTECSTKVQVINTLDHNIMVVEAIGPNNNLTFSVVGPTFSSREAVKLLKFVDDIIAEM